KTIRRLRGCFLLPCSRIRFYDQRLRVALDSHRQPHRVISRQDSRTETESLTTAPTGTTGRRCRRWSRSKIPDPTMHSRRSRQRFRRRSPERWDVERVWIQLRWLISARITSNYVATWIQYLKHNWSPRITAKVIIDRRPERRVLSKWFISRLRRSVITSGYHVDGRCRLEQQRIRRSSFAKLSQGA